MGDILIHVHDGTQRTVDQSPDQSLAQAIFLSGLWQQVPLCSGLGKCGLCRVRFISEPPPPRKEEIKKLTSQDVEAGWRLACLHPAEECTIGLPEPARMQRHISFKKPTQGDFSLAVDLGTTSMQWSVVAGDEVVATNTLLNPQIGLGSEVMSRLAYAAEHKGGKVLQELLLDTLGRTITGATINMGGECLGLVISGNPAMTYLLLGLDIKGLASAPYALGYPGGDLQVLSKEMPRAYIPPLLAPFVGADLSAGLTALHHGDTPPRYPYMLADLGTNGEFILALSAQEHICASVPMGPALEGVGLSAGRTAGPGAISGFVQSPAGIAPSRIPGETAEAPQGMTGTGYLSLAALLLREGVLDETGLYQSGSTPLACKLAGRLCRRGNEPAFEVLPGLHVPAGDIEEMLKVKAAFNLALSRLLKEAGMSPDDLSALYLAGALGEHVNLEDLVTLGFLPETLKSRTIKAGNTSLRGSELLTIRPELRTWLASVPNTVRVLELAGDGSFGQHYMERMRFTYVD